MPPSSPTLTISTSIAVTTVTVTPTSIIVNDDIISVLVTRSGSSRHEEQPQKHLLASLLLRGKTTHAKYFVCLDLFEWKVHSKQRERPYLEVIKSHQF